MVEDNISFLDPITYFIGTMVILAPHMDDEVLACGGIIAKLQQKDRIHIVYATDGMKSPAPIVPGRDSVSPDLGEVRMMESKAAMKLLGVREENLHFLRLPEAKLKNHASTLRELLKESIKEINPDFIFVPFRYDRHPDHLIINQVATEGCQQGWYQAQLIEYFVYYRWRLLPAGDIRKYIRPNNLIAIDIQDVAKLKRMALDCFKSQTTIYYPWQTRPILTSKLMDEECQNPELFLLHNPALRRAAVFSKAILWIKLAHYLEPFLQKWKYRVGAFLKRAIKKYV